MKKIIVKKHKLKFYIIIKKFFDLLFSIFFLIVCLPLFFVISILIKFNSRGPIFFSQKRIGKNNIPFRCIKFRTMHPEAKDILENLLTKNDLLKKEFNESHKIKNDPRITAFGKFLRKTSLDELPQFINVIKGDMSIVGPRPIVKEEKPKYGKYLKKVLSVKPGITGLWQVSGRNNLTYKNRVLLDLNYVRNSNFIMDFRILIRTLGVILFPLDRGAY
mgnify:CR=1 FL=1|tara:strand:+ start:5011 stop:5664 length:654 start_codon:yes stop_codon:yes gene_type:complete